MNRRSFFLALAGLLATHKSRTWEALPQEDLRVEEARRKWYDQDTHLRAHRDAFYVLWVR